MTRPAVDLAQLVELLATERLALVQALWESLRADPGALPLSDADRALVEERQAEHRRDPHGALEWESVRPPSPRHRADRVRRARAVAGAASGRSAAGTT